MLLCTIAGWAFLGFWVFIVLVLKHSPALNDLFAIFIYEKNLESFLVTQFCAPHLLSLLEVEQQPASTSPSPTAAKAR